MEDIAGGERVRKYEVDAWLDGAGKQVCEGISVGHKRIQQFDTVTTNKLRLTIKDSHGIPVLKDFAAFYLN